MDTKDTKQYPKRKTEDYFPGTSGAWSNAWCMDVPASATSEDEGHTDYRDPEDPEAGWEAATS
jgi:hypothetical protein